MRFGIQFSPLPVVPEAAAYASRAMSQHPFERLWVPDHLTLENPFVTLAAILAETGAHVGTSVANPVCRTPVDLASNFSALAHLAGDSGLTAGLGAGSSSSNMIRKQHRVGMLREMILFLREMFDGQRVQLGEFPRLADFFRLDPAAEAFLRLPPERAPDGSRRPPACGVSAEEPPALSQGTFRRAIDVHLDFTLHIEHLASILFFPLLRIDQVIGFYGTRGENLHINSLWKPRFSEPFCLSAETDELDFVLDVERPLREKLADGTVSRRPTQTIVARLGQLPLKEGVLPDDRPTTIAQGYVKGYLDIVQGRAASAGHACHCDDRSAPPSGQKPEGAKRPSANGHDPFVL